MLLAGQIFQWLCKLNRVGLINMNKQRLLSLDGLGQHVDMATYFEIQKTLHEEAYLLDHEKLDQWCDMLDDDLIYWAPLRENKLRRERTPEITVDRCSLFEETKQLIEIRLRRNDSGMCWTEDPPTRHAYSVSNIQAFHTENADELEVHSVFTLYRSRFERDDSTLLGRRKDIWRKVGDKYLLAGRLILLQQSTLLVKNLNVFF